MKHIDLKHVELEGLGAGGEYCVTRPKTTGFLKSFEKNTLVNEV